MRFADSPTTEVAVHVEAPPSAVWAFVTDLDVLAQFSDEFQGGEWLDPSTAPGVGARFHGRNENPRAAWDVTCTVTDWEPGRAFGWCVEDPDAPVASWRFTLDVEDGGTRLAYWARMGPGPSGVTSFIAEHPENEERIVDGRLATWTANMEATVDGIRGLAEGGPDPD
ncbi:MAG TPA: SRPBCC family protein [Acidimicrobiales bacterium]